MKKELHHKNNTQLLNGFHRSYLVLLFAAFLILLPAKSHVYGANAKYIVLMIADGWGVKHIEAANIYRNEAGESPPVYQTDPAWTKYLITTFPYGGGYDPVQAVSNFNYLLSGFVDSAGAATALYTGIKTQNSRITVSHDGSDRLFAIADEARAFGKTVGAVSTVPLSHATPGAWFAHNNDRGNFFALADEGLFGNPNTTGLPSETGYAGGHGPTNPPADVIIGDGRSSYVNSQIRNKLSAESGIPGKHYLVERANGIDGGDELFVAAQTPGVTKLAGLFDHFYRNADGLGGTPAERLENPTLAESTVAALKVLDNDPNGFVLMVEGGAVDWASHANNLDQMIGEMKDFDHAIQAVIDWVDDSSNDSSWDNTLLIVTGDHECGYLTKDFGLLPDVPIGEVSSTTLAKEKIVNDTGGRRASWDDANGNSYIDSGEPVYWAWNSGNHTNSVIPLYAKGFGSELFAGYVAGYDLLFQGDYLNNSDVFNVMYTAMTSCTETGSISIIPGQTLSGNPVDLTSIVNTNNAANLFYTVQDGSASCDVDLNGTYIEAENFTGTISQGSAAFSVETSQGGYLGNGYLRSNGGGFGNCPAIEEGKEYEVNFPVAGTYTIWIRGYAASKSSDSLFIGLDGTCTGALRETSPSCSGTECDPFLNAWIWTNFIQNGTNTITVATPGIHRINIWVREPNHLIDGIYITQGGETPTDASHGVEVDPTNCAAVIFSGDKTEAASVNTTGWTEGEKGLTVRGDDATCLTPLPPANDSFIFEPLQGVETNCFDNIDNDGDGLTDCADADCNSMTGGTCTTQQPGICAAGTLTCQGGVKVCEADNLPQEEICDNLDNNCDGSIDENLTRQTTCGVGECAGNTGAETCSAGAWGNNTCDPFAGASPEGPPGDGTCSDTLDNDCDGNTDINDPDCISNCQETGSLSIIPGQTLSGNPVDLTSIVNTSNAANLFYTVQDGSASCDVDLNGTYIEAENFTGTISQGSAVFSVETAQGGYLGNGYLRSNGGGFGNCPAIEEGKEYEVNFPVAGTYTVWIRGYAASKSSDSLFIGLDGACTGALRETSPSCSGTECDPFLNTWIWTNFIQNGTNTITVATPGIHRINIWVREPDHLIDGIYITQGGETPTDASHGVEVNPTNCTAVLFSGDATEAASVNTTGWTEGEKGLTVLGDDATCLIPLPPANNSFIFETSSQDTQSPLSFVGDPADLSLINSLSPDPYTVSGTASDNEEVQGIEVSINGGAWTEAVCTGCPGASVPWTYSWDLPADGNYTLQSRATDSSSNVETPSAGNVVTVNRSAPSVTSTVPANTATGVTMNSDVIISWDEDVDCTSVTTSTVTMDSGGWSFSSCSGSQAVFNTSGQTGSTVYTVTVSSQVTDSDGNPMTADHQFSYTTGGPSAIDWGACRTETGRTAIAAGSVQKDLTLITPVTNTAKAFVLVDSSGNSQVRQGRYHMVSADITDTHTVTFRRAGSTGQAEISYALLECFNNEFIVQRGELVLPSGATTGTAAITAVNMNNTIVLVSSHSNITANAQYQAHVTGELLDATTVKIRRASEATGADTLIIYQVVEFSAASGVTIQTGEVALNRGQSKSDTLSSAVDLNSTWLYFSYDASNNGLRQTAINGQLTPANQVTFSRDTSRSYNNRIRYYVIEFPPGDVTVQRGSSSFTGGGAATQSHSITISPVSDVNKTWTYVTNTTNGSGTAFPRNRWTETLSSASTIEMTNWRANNSAASGSFQWQVMEFTGKGQ